MSGLVVVTVAVAAALTYVEVLAYRHRRRLRDPFAIGEHRVKYRGGVR